MQLSITEKALEKLKSLEVDDKKKLLLWYETEGLGCAINGIPTIRFVKEIEPSYEKVDNPSYPTYVDEEFLIYFQQDLTLDHTNGMFRLSCTDEILNAFISESSINKDIK